RRDEDALDAASNGILNAVDLLQLVLVGRHRGNVPAELLSTATNAAQHGDIEGIVVLRERYADGDVLLSRRRRRHGQRGRYDQRGGKHRHASLEHANSSMPAVSDHRGVGSGFEQLWSAAFLGADY